MDYSTYDMYPFYNITAKLVVEASRSISSDKKIVEDEFLISIAERCRKMTFSSGMTFNMGG